MTQAAIVAYVGEKVGDGMGVDRFGDTSRRFLTDWHGNKIGHCNLYKSWPVPSHIGNRMYQIYATMGDKVYTGRGFGVGMSVVLRETAASKRKANS